MDSISHSIKRQLMAQIKRKVSSPDRVPGPNDYRNAFDGITQAASQLLERPEMAPFREIYEETSDEFAPSNCFDPPFTPLSQGFFESWLYFDLKAGPAQETIGEVLLKRAGELSFNKVWLNELRCFVDSRMGLYEYQGESGDTVTLKELVTDKIYSCFAPLPFRGRQGDLWFCRLLPFSLHDEVSDKHLVFASPYVFAREEKSNWLTCIQEQVSQGSRRDAAANLKRYFKYGTNNQYWIEFVFEAYLNFHNNVCYLTGTPNRPESRPHSLDQEIPLSFFLEKWALFLAESDHRPKDYLYWRELTKGLIRSIIDGTKDQFGPDDYTHVAWKEWYEGEDRLPLADHPEADLYNYWYLFRSKRPLKNGAGTKNPAVVFSQLAPLSPDQQTLLDAALKAGPRFLEVESVIKGQSFKVHDLLTGTRCEISELTASNVLKPRDVLCASLVTMGNLTFLMGMGPFVITAEGTAEVLALRYRLKKLQKSPLDQTTLVQHSEEIFKVYRKIRPRRLLNPGSYESSVKNSDGELFKPQTLSFQLSISPQRAFDDLKDLAITVDYNDFQGRKERKSGEYLQVKFPWLKCGNALHENWDFTVLGKISISTNQLEIMVNSVERGEVIRKEIERRLGAGIRFKKVVLDRSYGDDFETDFMGPMVLDEQFLMGRGSEENLQTKMFQQHWKEWILTPLEIFGQKSPIEVVKDQDGRELILDLLKLIDEREADAKAVTSDMAWVRRQLGLEPPKRGEEPMKIPTAATIKERQLMRCRPCSMVFQDFTAPAQLLWADMDKDRESDAAMTRLNMMCNTYLTIWNVFSPMDRDTKNLGPGAKALFEEALSEWDPNTREFLERIIFRRKYMFKDLKYLFVSATFYKDPQGAVRCRAAVSEL